MRHTLKEVRMNRGLTQEELSKKIGVARPYYTRIELGERNPSLSVAFKIKQVLNYNGDDIFLNYDVS